MVAGQAASPLIDAVRRGLGTVDGGVDWVGRFDSSLKELGEIPEDKAVRALAAELLREAIDDWFAVDANREREWRWACGKHRTLSSTVSGEKELSGAVIIRLKTTAGHFERAEDAWDPQRWANGGEPRWFPVRERGFAAWVRDATGKDAGVIVKDASKRPIPADTGEDGALLVGGPDRPGVRRPPPEEASRGGVTFDKVRALVARVAVSDDRVLSPDLVGRTGKSRLATEQLVRVAALSAAGTVFDFLEDRFDRLATVERLCTEAVRTADPGETRPTRVAPDVAFALAEALRLAAKELEKDPFVAGKITAATALAFTQWRFAQLPMVTKSLFEALTADPNDDRRRGRGCWASGLCADLAELRTKRGALVSFRLVSDQARAAVGWLGEEATLDGIRVERRRAAQVAAGVAPAEPGLTRFGHGTRGEVALTLLVFEQSLNEFITMAGPGSGDRRQEDR